MSAVDVRDQSRECLVLKSEAYREQDRLLTLLSSEQGRERAIARGAAKPTGALRPIAQPFTQVSLVLSPAKGGIAFVREGRPLQCFLPLTAGLERFAYGAYCSELALSVAQPGQPAPALYTLLLATLTLLKLDAVPERTARFFELRLLDSQGLLPDLEACGACGAPVGEGMAHRSRFFVLSPQQGRLLCDECLLGATREEAEIPRLSPGAVRTAQRLRTLPLPRIPALTMGRQIGRELEQALAVYLAYHLEYAPQARKVIQQLKSNDNYS